MSMCNPCSCLSSCIQQTKPTPCPVNDSCCLKACNGLIVCDDAVGPCGQTGTTQLNEISHELGGCSGTEVYRLNSYDTSIFTSVSLKVDGTLTWVTKGADTVGKFGEICFKIVCQSECDDCAELRANGTITIGIKDQCIAHSCQECEYCNPCTGMCEVNDTNLKVQESSQKSNIQVNG